MLALQLGPPLFLEGPDIRRDVDQTLQNLQHSNMASVLQADESVAEIKREDDADDSVVEEMPRILHNEHSPSMCALQVQVVFERYVRQERHLLELVDRNCKHIEESGRLTVENLKAKQELKTSVIKMNKMQKEMQTLEEKLSDASVQVTRLREAQLDASVVKEDVQLELERVKAEKERLAQKIEDLNSDLVLEKELTAKANQKLREALQAKIDQSELAKRFMQEAQQHAAQKEQEIAEELADIENQKMWIEQQKLEAEELHHMHDNWLKEKDMKEIELNRLRELNRDLRYKVSHPNKKPESDPQMVKLNTSLAHAEELQRQLYNANMRNLELEKQLNQHNVRQHKRMTFAKPTQSFSQHSFTKKK